jgi:hypothetical protein
MTYDLLQAFILDIVMPVIEQKGDAKILNRIRNTTITLNCHIRGQAGMEVSWKRNGQVVQESSFEKITTEYPQELVISAVTKTQINITYENNRDIYDRFYCRGNRNNLLCTSIYSCSATYPGANTSSQGRIPVTGSLDIGTRLLYTVVYWAHVEMQTCYILSLIFDCFCFPVLPDVPSQPSISNIKSRSAVINWSAADDYLESLLEKYVIQVSSGSYTMRINVTSGIEQRKLSYRLKNLKEYTFYNVSIAAENLIAISNFTKKVSLFTLCKYMEIF